MNIFDLRMNGFSTETVVCLQTLHYSESYWCCQRILCTDDPHDQRSEVFTKSSAFQESILMYSIQLCYQVPSKHFCFGGDLLL